MAQSVGSSDRCQRCNKGAILTDSNTGEMVCSKCGFVATDRVEQEGPEWRAFSKEEGDNRTRTGTPTSLAMHDMGLATIINPQNKERLANKIG
jgi:transcription initiation factor TFIIB